MHRKKKIIGILAFCLMFVLPVMVVMAENGLLSPGGTSVEAGETLSFRMNLKEIPEEYSNYSITLKISPSPEQLSLSENVNVMTNHVNGTYVISSADLSSVTALNFKVKAPADLSEDTNYHVEATVTAEAGQKSDSFSFAAKAKQEVEEPEEPTTEQGTDKENAADSKKQEANKQQGAGQNKQGNNKMFSGNTGGSKSGGSAGSITGNSVVSNRSVTQVNPNLVYNGSADNYLKKLSVEGYDFTQKFNKTRDTYFVHVKKSPKTMNVTATPSDSSADVSITGTDDLDEDRSKIQINVTADNGEVRIYRIYVIYDTEE